MKPSWVGAVGCEAWRWLVGLFTDGRRKPAAAGENEVGT